jgi:hypothetical protein
MGFHPKSAWRSDGKDKDGGNMTYDPPKNRDVDGDNIPDTLKERKGPYLEVATSNVFRLGNSSGSAEDGLFASVGSLLEKNTHVICDVFTVRRITLGSGSAAKTIKAGTPILYYRANTSSKTMDSNSISQLDKLIYNADDNYELIKLKNVTVDGSPGNKDHPLGGNTGKDLYKFDYDGGIRDSKITGVPWPHRPDSYILISAGVDGEYGTSDDIRNF